MTANFNYQGPSHEAIETALRTVVAQSMHAQNAAREALTERQMIEALRQALACGDFQVLVRHGDGAQCVSYLPYRHDQELREKIRELKAKIKSLENELSDYRNAPGF